MDVFKVHEQVISDYRAFTSGFVQPRDRRISTFIEDQFAEGVQWPDPWLSLNPSFATGDSITELVTAGLLHPECDRIFRRKPPVASCSSHVDAVSAQAVRSEAKLSAQQIEFEKALEKDRAEVRRTAAAADAALSQVRQELADVRDDLSEAVSSASESKAEDRQRQANADQRSEQLNERLRELESRMGDFLRGCDELVRAEIAAQLADSLPMLTDPVQTR